MATFITTDQTTTQTMSSGEQLVLVEGVQIAANGDGIAASMPNIQNLDVHVAGRIYASLVGIDFRADTASDGTGNGSHDVFVASTGSVSSIDSDAISMNGRSNVLTNYGAIDTTAFESRAIVNFGDDASIRNFGTVSAVLGIELQSPVGISGASVVNGGQILAESVGITAVDVALDLVNSGEILAYNPDSNGVGVRVFESSGVTDARVENSGTIGGQDAAINFIVSGTAFVSNSGMINGDVNMGSGAGRFENSAAVSGVISLEDGVDVYRGDGDSNVSGGVYGGVGEDRMFGGQNADVMSGDDDGDKIRGRAGDDELYGGAGIDDIKGNDGDDVIQGNQDNDVLRGGRGDDVIFGGSGEDEITGGAGNDVLSGNSGNDVFVFSRKSGIDEITDFTNNRDKLDLSAFDVTSRLELTAAGAIKEDGAGSLIDLRFIGGDGFIYVEDMTVLQWGNTDFIF